MSFYQFPSNASLLSSSLLNPSAGNLLSTKNFPIMEINIATFFFSYYIFPGYYKPKIFKGKANFKTMKFV